MVEEGRSMTQSSRGILDRLSDHLDHVAEELSTSFQAASDKHAGTPEAVATDREHSLREVVRRFFPEPFKVTKGAIYDSYEKRSASIDCVICAPNHPYLVGGDGKIEIILVDGVFAAIELKPVLTDLPPEFGKGREQRPELIRGLEQVRSVKRLRRTQSAVLKNFSPTPSDAKVDYSFRCPSYIVADTAAPIPELAKYVADYYIAHSIPPEEQVDAVFALKGGLLLFSKAPDHTQTQVTGREWHPHVAGYEPSPRVTSHFFLRLISDIGPELPLSKPVLQRYLEKLPRPTPTCGFPTVGSGGA
jgi:hypothetical protein